MLNLIALFIGGLFKALFAPVLQWFHDSAVRQDALVQAHAEQAQKIINDAQEAKRASEAIDRQPRADVNAVYDGLYAARHKPK